MVRRVLFFALLAACVILLARVSEQYPWRIDLSAQRIHTLSPSAARALEALAEGLKITAFVPDYPVQRAQLEQLFAPYLAAGPAVRLEFIDPVKEPARAREQGVARHGEVHLASGTRREIVATASRQAIDLALNRLALKGERWIVSFTGHGEGDVDETPGGLGRFVAHVEQLGYRFVALDPRGLDALPDNTALLMIVGPRSAYGAHSLALIEDYLAAGGALLWLVEGPLPDFIGRDLGVDLLPGIVVDAAAAQYGFDSPDNAIVSPLPRELQTPGQDGFAVLKQAQALQLRPRDGWRTHERLESSPRSWNETGSLRGQIVREPELDEQAGPLTVGVLLRPASGPPGQGVALIGSRQFIGNDQLGQGANQALAVGLVRWLTANQQLADSPPAAGLEIRWSPSLAAGLALGLMGALPLLYLATGLWLRARRRRA